MIIHLKQDVSDDKATQLAEKLQAIHVNDAGKHILVTTSKMKTIENGITDLVDEYFVSDTDIQLAGRHYINTTREVQLGNVTIGGTKNNTVFISGPCSIESREQIEEVAQVLLELDIKILRAGCYKPRTSPYSFQGMGLDGLKLLAEMREKYGFSIITEVRDATHVNDVIEYSDIIQIGAKAMYDQGILRRCGEARKPILLKRGFGSTLQEFVQAAEFILSGGNNDVVLCERGIRTFETKTRFTLDLCGVAYLKEHTNLPIILDTSHAMGYAYGVPDLTRACAAMGVDGLLIESHPNPKVAMSDASQQLNFDQLRDLYKSLKPVCNAVGRKLV